MSGAVIADNTSIKVAAFSYAASNTSNVSSGSPLALYTVGSTEYIELTHSSWSSLTSAARNIYIQYTSGAKVDLNSATALESILNTANTSNKILLPPGSIVYYYGFGSGGLPTAIKLDGVKFLNSP